MRKVVAGILAALVLGVWLFTGSRAQPSVSQDTSTAQAQLTQVVGPTPSSTP